MYTDVYGSVSVNLACLSTSTHIQSCALKCVSVAPVNVELMMIREKFKDLCVGFKVAQQANIW